MSGGRIGSAPPRGPGQVADRHLLPTRLGKLHLRTLAPAGGAGNSRRTPLVLLHMGPQSSRMWDRVAPLLAGDRLVVMPDRIGFGDSDHVEQPVPFAEYAAATLEAIDGLAEATGADLTRFDTVGAHTGSCEVVELAAVACPQRVRRAGVLALPVLTAEQADEYRTHYVPPRAPQLDGSHLLDPWQWWLKWLPAKWGLDLVHQRTLDVLRAEPDSWRAFHAVFDYPFAETLALVTQPFLVLAPRDDLWELTQVGLPLCPPQTEVVDLPGVTLEGWWLQPELLGGHLRRFLDAP